MIELCNVYKSFDEKELFCNLNLEIQDYEFLVLAGPSGCGKTTLLNMIGGIEKCDGGSIIVNGMDISKRKNMRNYFTNYVGFLFQNFALMENRTVEENMKIVQKNARSGMEIDDILDELGISDKKKEKVYKLSGGEQQRVAIARLMYKKCDIILADEPTGSLDQKNANGVLDILHRLNDKGKTIILVTHDEKIIAAEANVKRIGIDI